MEDFLLFIDTEASGLPKNWKAPFSEENNWPFAVQISWIVYTKAGKEVKRENFFINNNDFEITPSALAIHHISPAFLVQHGVNRNIVLDSLASDLRYYQPLVVGHFMEFDALVLGAEYYRTNKENPLTNLPVYCTMLATKNFIRNPRLQYLNLGALYFYLFNTTLENQHNALVDAVATAKCFFELLKRGDINDELIREQQVPFKKLSDHPSKLGCSLGLIIFIFSGLILHYCL